jgi:hypothetical protein
VSVSAIQLGQLWRVGETGENWLVTRVYKELFTSYAVLRKVGGTDADVRRVKVERSADGVTLPGYVFAQESEGF